jgi:hypothetical protein
MWKGGGKGRFEETKEGDGDGECRCLRDETSGVLFSEV